jgi:CRISPR-associated protein Csy2
MKLILLIPKIKIHNANALSSPYTIGFPAMTAWLGGTHALERMIRAEGYGSVHFKSMSVVCHSIDLQTYKGQGDYVYSIISTGNPLDKEGKRASFIEEARCHLTVSLVIEFENLGLVDHNEFIENVDSNVRGRLKLAGGDILDCAKPEFIEIDNEISCKKLLRKLMPGHCLIERRDLMIQSMEEGKDAIDALLDYVKVTYGSEVDEDGAVSWSSHRKEKGWIVPIATGFHGITGVGTAENQRDPDTPHRFAESIVTLGEFVMPYRIAELDEMLWHYYVDLDNNLYLCQQNKFFNMN